MGDDVVDELRTRGSEKMISFDVFMLFGTERCLMLISVQTYRSGKEAEMDREISTMKIVD